MRRFDFWKLSVRSLLSAPIRTALTVLGMAIGVGAILAVLTLGEAGKDQVESELTRLGVDRVWLTADGAEGIRLGDAALLSRALGVTVTEQAYAPVTARRGNAERQAVLVGCSLEYLRVMDTEVLAGRDLHPLEWKAGSRAVLVGEALAEELRLRPYGEVYVGGFALRVVGIARQRNELTQVDATRAVFLPVEAYCALMGDRVHELTVVVPRAAAPRAVALMAEEALLRGRGVEAKAVTMQAQIDAANTVVALFVDVLKWVALICILVGGVGVMNILLVGVRERRREIGVMQSLGASRAQVCGLFLLEALLYALVGGALGLLTGVGLIRVAGGAIGLSPSLSAADCALTFSCALGVGLTFGVVPAARAARLKPVDALRED